MTPQEKRMGMQIAALRKKVERLEDALLWIADHSNDPGVVKRAHDELEK